MSYIRDGESYLYYHNGGVHGWVTDEGLIRIIDENWDMDDPIKPYVLEELKKRLENKYKLFERIGV
jgi:hypothetical protein